MKVVHAWCLEPVEQADLGGATNPNLSPPLRRACRVDCSTFFRCPPLAGANCSWFALAFLAIDPVPCWMGVRGSTKPTTRLIFRVAYDDCIVNWFSKQIRATCFPASRERDGSW